MSTFLADGGVLWVPLALHIWPLSLRLQCLEGLELATRAQTWFILSGAHVKMFNSSSRWLPLRTLATYSRQLATYNSSRLSAQRCAALIVAQSKASRSVHSVARTAGGSAALRSAAQRSAVQHSAVQRSAVQRSAVRCGAVQCSAAQCSAVQCSADQIGHSLSPAGSRPQRNATQREPMRPRCDRVYTAIRCRVLYCAALPNQSWL